MAEILANSEVGFDQAQRIFNITNWLEIKAQVEEEVGLIRAEEEV